MSDAPEAASPEVRGGKQRGDAGMEGASETGRSGAGHPVTGMDVDENSETNLQAEKGGSAGGGTG